MDKIFIRSSVEEIWFYQPLLNCVEEYENEIMSHDENNKWVSSTPTLQHLHIQITTHDVKGIWYENDEHHMSQSFAAEIDDSKSKEHEETLKNKIKVKVNLKKKRYLEFKVQSTKKKIIWSKKHRKKLCQHNAAKELKMNMFE